MRARIYVDASIVGGCEDDEFATHSLRLMESFAKGEVLRESRSEKKFDAVEMMRSARDSVSAEIEGMTLEEELEWLASQDLDDPFLERLRARAQPPAPARRTARVR